MSRHLKFWLPPLLAGGLWAAAFPGAGVAGFAWLVPGLVLFAAQASGRPFLGAYLAGLFGWLGQLHWLLHIPFPGGAVAGWLSLSAYLALFPTLWAWLCLRTLPPTRDPGSFLSRLGALPWGQRQLWAVGCAALWTGLELVQNRFLTGFPWNNLGVSQFRLTPLVQLAAWTGVAGLTFLIVWFSVCLTGTAAVLLRSAGRMRTLSGEILLPLCAVVAVFVTGMNRVRTTGTEESRPLRLALVQPSIPQLLIWDPSGATNRFETMLELTRRALALKPDAVVWPEASLPGISADDYARLAELIREGRVPLVFGADDVETGADGRELFYNSAFVLGSDAVIGDRYRKRRLVVFGEYVPLERWLPFMKWLTPIGGGFESGRYPGEFVVESGDRPFVASPLICFEDAFAPLARVSVNDETDLLLNLTNDGWFGESAAQWQHAANALFRAVENRRPLARCTNNGLTCWIDEHGRVRQVLTDAEGGVHAAGVLLAELELPMRKETTFYRRHGDVFGWSCLGLGLLWGLRPLVLRRRDR